MRWVAPTEKDDANHQLEKRLWDAADQFRANSGLKAGQYSMSVPGFILANVKIESDSIFLPRRPGVAASKRESLGTPMGNVTFDPPEAQLVKQDLEAELSRLMAAKGIMRKAVTKAFEEFNAGLGPVIEGL